MQKVEVELIDRNGRERSANQNGGQVGGRWQYLNTKFEGERYEQINVLIMDVLMKKKSEDYYFLQSISAHKWQRLIAVGGATRSPWLNW